MTILQAPEAASAGYYPHQGRNETAFPVCSRWTLHNKNSGSGLPKCLHALVPPNPVLSPPCCAGMLTLTTAVLPVRQARQCTAKVRYRGTSVRWCSLPPHSPPQLTAPAQQAFNGIAPCLQWVCTSKRSAILIPRDENRSEVGLGRLTKTDRFPKRTLSQNLYFSVNKVRI